MSQLTILKVLIELKPKWSSAMLQKPNRRSMKCASLSVKVLTVTREYLKHLKMLNVILRMLKDSFVSKFELAVLSIGYAEGLIDAIRYQKE